MTIKNAVAVCAVPKYLPSTHGWVSVSILLKWDGEILSFSDAMSDDEKKSFDSGIFDLTPLRGFPSFRDIPIDTSKYHMYDHSKSTFIDVDPKTLQNLKEL